jgi:superfamily I DNA/RNA helicase
MDSKEIDVSHDFYLKKFQLNIKKYPIKYDIVLLDEAQDINWVTADIFKKITNKTNSTKKILVGDKNQKIYGFRGAKNIIDQYACDNIFYLTKSFRYSDRSNFEQVIQANRFLFYLCGSEKIIDIEPKPFIPKRRYSSCIITRTNAGVLDAMTAYPDYAPCREPDIFFENIFKIFEQKISVNKKTNSFREYVETLYEESKLLNDKENLLTCKLIKKNGYDKNFYKKLRYKAEENYDNRSKHRFIGTAHSVKGLEFDIVVIHDDFMGLYVFGAICLKIFLKNYPYFKKVFYKKDKYKIKLVELSYIAQKVYDLNPELREEINLVYVAITRAMHIIEIPESLTIKKNMVFYYDPEKIE